VNDGCNGVWRCLEPTSASGRLRRAEGLGQIARCKKNNNHEISPRIGLAWDPKVMARWSFAVDSTVLPGVSVSVTYLYLTGNAPFSLSVGGQRYLGYISN